jgi:hypothetical protein
MRATLPLDERLAGAPISSEACDVPGGWLGLEQDTAITGDEPTVSGGPMRDARQSIAFLHHSARTMEEIDR